MHNLRRLTYTCIYCKSPEEAIDNMYRIICNNENGFIEGKESWKNELSSILSQKPDIEEFNFHGTSFSKEWWEASLKGLLTKLNNE